MAGEAAAQVRVRRIVAALELKRRPADGLEAIAELARSMEAELLGLFIEDIGLLHFAALPFACEVGAASAVPREVDFDAMEHSMRARAEELRLALAEVTETRMRKLLQSTRPILILPREPNSG